MLSWDEATCWRKLEEFCEEAKDKQYTNEVDLGHARRIVEALARHGQGCEERSTLCSHTRGRTVGQGALRDGWSPWSTSGREAHLESTVPLLVTHLLEDLGDLDNEECAEALARIGTPAVLHAVAEAFPTAEYHFRTLRQQAAGDDPLRPRRGDVPAPARPGEG